MDIFITIAEKFGIPVAILVYFIVRDIMNHKAAVKRETQMTERIQLIEDYQRTKLETLTADSIIGLKASAISNDRLTEILARKPCVADEVQALRARREL